MAVPVSGFIVVPSRDELAQAKRADRAYWRWWTAYMAWKPRAPRVYDSYRRGDGSLYFAAMADDGLDIS